MKFTVNTAPISTNAAFLVGVFNRDLLHPARISNIWVKFVAALLENFLSIKSLTKIDILI